MRNQLLDTDVQQKMDPTVAVTSIELKSNNNTQQSNDVPLVKRLPKHASEVAFLQYS